MSGRDFKAFLASHQYQLGRNDSRLVNRFLDGKHPGTYKEVDFERLLSLAKIKRSAGQRTLKKLESLEQSSSQRKEMHLIAEHKSIWKKEYSRLKNSQRSLEEELDQFCSSSIMKSVNYCFEVASCKEQLRDNFCEFEESTIQPIKDLREDLIFWLQENREKLILNIAHEEHAEVMGVVQSVKFQQKEIIEKLENEEEICENNVLDSMAILGIESVDFKLPSIETGVPEEARLLVCPDDAFKLKVFKEFNILDSRYATELKKLEERYKAIIERYPRGGWSVDDHSHFIHILEQYSSVETADRRRLYLDRMVRELSHFTRRELVDHETWWFNYKSFGNQMKDLINAWLRDREDLLIKINALFAEYALEYQHKRENELDKQRQQSICEALHRKLDKYQAQRDEIIRLEAIQKLKEQQALQQERENKHRKETERRTIIKKKVDDYNTEKQRRQELCMKEDQERLAQLRMHLEQQKERDLERIKFRKEEYKKKVDAQRKQKEEMIEEEKEKQCRLERLRAQVRVEADVDPDRIFKNTEASNARVVATYDEEKNLLDPLFNINTYNVQQITSDKRLRMEQALRAVGLHNSVYARHILSTVAPPTQPRRDQKSTVFRNENSKGKIGE